MGHEGPQTPGRPGVPVRGRALSTIPGRSNSLKCVFLPAWGIRKSWPRIMRWFRPRMIEIRLRGIEKEWGVGSGKGVGEGAVAADRGYGRLSSTVFRGGGGTKSSFGDSAPDFGMPKIAMCQTLMLCVTHV